VRPIVLYLLTMTFVTFADASGRWAGTIRTPSADEAQSAKLVLHLKQERNVLTGTAGNDEDHLSAIRNGRINGDSIEFDVDWGNTAHFELALRGDEMTGEMRGDPKDAPPGKHPARLLVALKRGEGGTRK